MDLIKMTRELGAAIQQDERYIAFSKAKESSEADEALNASLALLQQLQADFAEEQSKDIPDESVLQKINDDFEKAYATVSESENMKKYETARGDVDGMMNEIMQILGLCVNGADPETCQPSHEHEGCDGDCSDGCCSGCSGC